MGRCKPLGSLNSFLLCASQLPQKQGPIQFPCTCVPVCGCGRCLCVCVCNHTHMCARMCCVCMLCVYHGCVLCHVYCVCGVCGMRACRGVCVVCVYSLGGWFSHSLGHCVVTQVRPRHLMSQPDHFPSSPSHHGETSLPAGRAWRKRRGKNPQPPTLPF